MAATTACKVLVRMGLTRDAWVISQTIRENLDVLKEPREWGELSFFTNLGVMRVLLRGEEDGGGRFGEIVDRRGRPGVDAYHKLNVNDICMLLGKPLIYPPDGSDLMQGYADYLAGRLREAHDRLAELVVRARERGLLEIELRSNIMMARIYLALGQHQKARETLDDALDLAGGRPKRAVAC
jgi:tetratricopeptide (TPR) repeat protein